MVKQSESQERYADYLNSDYWKRVSKAVKERGGYRCQVCNSPHDLSAHHRTYENRGNELNHLDDLICLCRRCHGIFHGKIETVQEVKTVVVEKVVEVRKEPEPLAFDVLITHQNCKRLRCTKEPWHWMRKVGIDPRRSGWAKRAIGHWVPHQWLR